MYSWMFCDVSYLILILGDEYEVPESLRVCVG